MTIMMKKSWFCMLVISFVLSAAVSCGDGSREKEQAVEVADKPNALADCSLGDLTILRNVREPSAVLQEATRGHASRSLA